MNRARRFVTGSLWTIAAVVVAAALLVLGALFVLVMLAVLG